MLEGTCTVTARGRWLIATVWTLALLPAPLAEAAAGATAAKQGHITETSHRQAKTVVERALDVMGSLDAIRATGGLVFQARGVMNQGTERQGRTPSTLDPAPFEESFAVDIASDRVAWEYRHDRYDGTQEWIREIYDEPNRQLLLILSDRFSVLLESPEFATHKRKAFRRIPHLLLVEVLDRSASLRSLGRHYGLEAVSASLATGETVTLLFDIESGVLARAEYLTDTQTFGDVIVRWDFEEYESLGWGGLFPHRYGVSLEGRPFTEMRVERVLSGPAAAERMFAIPDDIATPALHQIPPETDASRNARVEQIAPGVHMVMSLRLGFHPMFVEFEDFVVAIDAPAGYRLLNEFPAGDVAPGPTSSWLSERYLELIRETVPDKPVRYVVLTHFHNDHAGGLRAFVADGATVLAAPSAREAVQQLTREQHTVAPDRLTESRGPLQLEVIEGSRIISDGSRTIEVLDVGRNPHTDHMLVINLPGEKIVYVSDLLTPTANVENFPTSNEPLDRFFVQWLDARGLDPEFVYTAHGAGRATREHLAKLRTQGGSK